MADHPAPPILVGVPRKVSRIKILQDSFGEPLGHLERLADGFEKILNLIQLVDQTFPVFLTSIWRACLLWPQNHNVVKNVCICFQPIAKFLTKMHPGGI